MINYAIDKRRLYCSEKELSFLQKYLSQASDPVAQGLLKRVNNLVSSNQHRKAIALIEPDPIIDDIPF